MFTLARFTRNAVKSCKSIGVNRDIPQTVIVLHSSVCDMETRSMRSVHKEYSTSSNDLAVCHDEKKKEFYIKLSEGTVHYIIADDNVNILNESCNNMITSCNHSSSIIST